MNALFDETKYTRWYVTDKGKLLSSSTYQGDGKIRTKKSNVCKRGYLYARTSNGNYQIHRLVASAFISNPENKPCVNHKNGDKHNNNKNNLEWVTHKENTQHAIKNGLFKLNKKNEGGGIKYTNKQCRDVLNRIKKGLTYVKAGEKYNMPYSTVAHLARGSRRSV